MTSMNLTASCECSFESSAALIIGARRSIAARNRGTPAIAAGSWGREGGDVDIVFLGLDSSIEVQKMFDAICQLKTLGLKTDRESMSW
jgi:hypothetical protein